MHPRNFLQVLWLSAAGLGLNLHSAQAYPIDCAILLCLAGGFPASLPCDAARFEMIRRITPWPIEPPLQLWRCPMHAAYPAQTPSGWPLPTPVSYPLAERHLPDQTNQHFHILASYDTTIQSYLAAIKVYDLSYSRRRNHEGSCNISASLQIGTYDAFGTFSWARGDTNSAIPIWMLTTSSSQCSDLWFRGVGLEWQDYQGSLGTEVVRY